MIIIINWLSRQDDGPHPGPSSTSMRMLYTYMNLKCPSLWDHQSQLTGMINLGHPQLSYLCPSSLLF